MLLLRRRRFSEIIERGNPSLPQNPTSPYEFIFEGQLKKAQESQPYLTYSLLPAVEVIKAVSQSEALRGLLKAGAARSLF